jgi:glutamyl-tRNA reductase
VQTAGAAVVSIAVTLIWGSTHQLAAWQAAILGAGAIMTALHLFLRRHAGDAAIAG